jgi:hypothetical protein
VGVPPLEFRRTNRNSPDKSLAHRTDDPYLMQTF